MIDISIWVLTVLLALMLIAGAVPKLQGASGMVRRFADWGYGPGFLTLIGVIETLGAVLLLVPRMAFWGAAILMIVMLGAIYTHLSTGIGSPAFALVTALLVGLIGWFRRPPPTGPSA